MLLIMKGVLMMIVDDVPESVKIQLGRTEFIVDRVIDDKQDDAMEIMEFTGTLPPSKKDQDAPRLNVLLGDNSYKRVDKIRGVDDDQDNILGSKSMYRNSSGAGLDDLTEGDEEEEP